MICVLSNTKNFAHVVGFCRVVAKTQSREIISEIAWVFKPAYLHSTVLKFLEIVYLDSYAKLLDFLDKELANCCFSSGKGSNNNISRDGVRLQRNRCAANKSLVTKRHLFNRAVWLQKCFWCETCEWFVCDAVRVGTSGLRFAVHSEASELLVMGTSVTQSS